MLHSFGFKEKVIILSKMFAKFSVSHTFCALSLHELVMSLHHLGDSVLLYCVALGVNHGYVSCSLDFKLLCIQSCIQVEDYQSITKSKATFFPFLFLSEKSEATYDTK